MRLGTAILALASAAACLGDTLKLRDGRVIQGTYMGGTARTIKMQVDDTVKTYDVSDAVSLQFTPPAPAPSATVPTRRQPADGTGAAPQRTTADARGRS